MKTTPHRDKAAWFRLMPGAFVFLWSTGFIGAKYGLPYAEPMTFLSVRFGIVMVVLWAIALAVKAPWPVGLGAIFHCMISGMLLHGVYLGGVFGSINLGMPAGISALIVGLQPLLTAVLSRPLLGEAVSRRQWLGLVLGLAGVGLVLGPRLTADAGQAMTTLNISFSIAALVGITIGTIYQKRFVTAMDLRTSGVWQFAGATILVGIGAVLFESMQIKWTWPFIGALSWLVIVLSLGAITLLIIIIRHGEISRVATLFYLVPPVTALIAFFVFDERLNLVQLAGMAVTAYGVWLGSQARIHS